jgi:hypothetical protein
MVTPKFLIVRLHNPVINAGNNDTRGSDGARCVWNPCVRKNANRSTNEGPKGMISMTLWALNP